MDNADSTLMKLLATMNRCKEVFDCNEATTIEDILNIAMDEVTRLRKQIHAGYKVVPIEPTESLIEIMAIAYDNSKAHDLIGPMEDAYKAMIAASPLIEGK